MKKTNQIILLALCAAGVLALSNKLTAADNVMPGCGMSGGGCCGGMPMAADSATNAPAASNAKPDLLKTCPVSGEKLGEMGKPLVFVYQDQEVKLCCKGCKKDFDKDPEKYIKLIRAADKK